MVTFINNSTDYKSQVLVCATAVFCVGSSAYFSPYPLHPLSGATLD